MAKFRNNDGTTELATIIGHDGLLEGNLTVKHSIRIDGTLKGDLKTTETVTIGKDGNVDGNISAKHLIVGGKIKGFITVNGKTTLESTSTLEGELKTGKLVIEEGAALNGSTTMGNAPANHGRILPKKEE
ncbi:MAG: polymer-forming cytoskeletal protein [FCB group bacterium]|nr:polymer-forming cytoskeletal protein [FCB group bacterium]